MWNQSQIQKIEIIVGELTVGYRKIFTTFAANFYRANLLVDGSSRFVRLEIANSEMNVASKDSNWSAMESFQEEVLRSVVVLLHSTLETLLSDLFIQHYKIALRFDSKPELPTNISIVGQVGKHSKQNVKLHQLIKHKHLSVSELIQASIEEYISYVSFNRVDDIIATLKQIELPVEIEDESAIANLIARRHKIVHEADISVKDEITPMEITYDDLHPWILSIRLLELNIRHEILKRLTLRVWHQLVVRNVIDKPDMTQDETALLVDMISKQLDAAQSIFDIRPFKNEEAKRDD